MTDSIGLMESSKRVVSTLLTIFQTRLELLSNEIEEERLRVRQMLFYGSIALFFFGLSIMLMTVFIVVLFWDSYRLPVLGGLAALFFLAGLLVWNSLQCAASERSKLFSSSLAELDEDRARLVSRS
jgi:uncharacterized membrane protein YqjE